MRSVAKFGGSSLSDHLCITRAVDLITSTHTALKDEIIQRQHVVVSAPGKRFPTDMKVTDTLHILHTIATQRNRQKFEALFHEHIERRFPSVPKVVLETVSRSIYDYANAQQHITPTSADFALSRGEFLNANVVAAQLPDFELVDPAESFIIFDPTTGLLNMERTLEAIRYTVGGAISAGRGFVIPGFYGSVGQDQANQTKQIQTFSRGGSDVTASLVAAAIDILNPGTTIHENFTDVDGIYTADPRICVHAKLLPRVGYQQIQTMALAGANVLHPDAIAPLKTCNVPCFVRNASSTNENVVGTHITANEVVSQTLPNGKGKDVVLAVCGTETTVSVIFKEDVDTECKLDVLHMLKALHLNSLSLQDNMISVKVDEQRRDDVIQLVHEQVIIVDKNID